MKLTILTFIAIITMSIQSHAGELHFVGPQKISDIQGVLSKPVDRNANIQCKDNIYLYEIESTSDWSDFAEILQGMNNFYGWSKIAANKTKQPNRVFNYTVKKREGKNPVYVVDLNNFDKVYSDWYTWDMFRETMEITTDSSTGKVLKVRYTNVTWAGPYNVGSIDNPKGGYEVVRSGYRECVLK